MFHCVPNTGKFRYHSGRSVIFLPSRECNLFIKAEPRFSQLDICQNPIGYMANGKTLICQIRHGERSGKCGKTKDPPFAKGMGCLAGWQVAKV